MTWPGKRSLSATASLLGEGVPHRQVASRLGVPRTTVASWAAGRKPRIVWDPIPFGARRKAEMTAYAERHYGIDSYKLVHPHVIVIHYTVTPSYQATFNTFAPDVPDPELHELPNTCAHYVVDQYGVIHQLVSVNIMCRHTVGLNWTAIGIEHVGYSDAQVLDDRKQMASSLALVRWLRCRLHIEINGSAPGTGYDQIKATGNVSFMGGLLALSMNTAGAVSNQYVIVDNDGVDFVGGTFTGLANGASITNNGIVFVVKYNGGDGNDVVLIQQNVAVGPQIGGIQPNGSGGMKISGVGLPNTLYNVEATESLNAPIVWKMLDNVLSDGSGLLNFEDDDASNFAMRFYRFVIP